MNALDRLDQLILAECTVERLDLVALGAQELLAVGVDVLEQQDAYVRVGQSVSGEQVVARHGHHHLACLQSAELG